MMDNNNETFIVPNKRRLTIKVKPNEKTYVIGWALRHQVDFLSNVELKCNFRDPHRLKKQFAIFLCELNALMIKDILCLVFEYFYDCPNNFQIIASRIVRAGEVLTDAYLQKTNESKLWAYE